MKEINLRKLDQKIRKDMIKELLNIKVDENRVTELLILAEKDLILKGELVPHYLNPIKITIAFSEELEKALDEVYNEIVKEY